MMDIETLKLAKDYIGHGCGEALRKEYLQLREALTPEVIQLLMEAWEFFEDERLDDFKNNPECWEEEDKEAFQEDIKKVNKAWPILEELRGPLDRPEELTEEGT